MACVSCRESKVKCDGAEPACSNCATRKRECRYQAVDKRKLPLRVAIELLLNRVDQLCYFIQDNGLKPPRMSAERDLALGRILEMLGLAETNTSMTQKATEARMTECQDTHPKAPVFPAAVCPSTTHELEQAELQQCPKSHPGTHPVNFRQTESVFALATVNTVIDYQNLAEANTIADSRDWDWQLGLDAVSTPISPYGHGFLESSPSEAPMGTAFKELSGSSRPLVADDERTLVDGCGSAEDIEGLIDELSDRLGTLHVEPGGKTQFYGPTSTFNLADMLNATYSKAHSTAQSDALECLTRLGANGTAPAALENHLINLYFCWQDPSFHVVDRGIYDEAMAKWYAMEDTSFYSESLRNAMCALGACFEARYHTQFVTFPKSLVEFFGERAKALLEMELDSPSIATVQALVILSNLESGSGRDARGWLYSGMAIRLAFNLALHLDMSSYISGGLITAADADLRRTVFWAAYTVDHELGFHLGRPFRTNMEDVTVKPNSGTGRHQQGEWVPYASLNAIHTGSGMPDCVDAVREGQITLCEIMAPCGYLLYGTSSISKVVLQEQNEKTVAKLLNWKEVLPPVLRIDIGDQTTPYTPQVMLLHMQYYQNMIYAHRPWMSKSHLQPQPPRGPGHRHAREMCIQSAICIARILEMYEARYTLRRIHTKAVAVTSSAVLLLLFAAVAQYSNGRDDILAHLSTCFRALDEFTISWPSATRAKDLLLRLQRRWEIRTRSNKKKPKQHNAAFPPTKPSPSSIELNGPSSRSHDSPTDHQTEPHGDISIDADIDWMLMPDEKCQSDNHAADLYSLLSNPAMNLDGQPGD
ncbi:fungal-specific transcription factor domain-containing protein [Aspergillus germanicus]